MHRKLKPRILSIDDDADIGLLIRRVFEETGRFIVEVENEPLHAIAKARQFRPDLLLVDISMPGRTGIELATQLRREPWLRYRPIVFFTSLATTATSATLPAGDGPTEFLAKGVPTDVLLATVDRLLANCATVAS